MGNTFYIEKQDLHLHSKEIMHSESIQCLTNTAISYKDKNCIACL